MKLKRILASLLVLAMVLTLYPVVFADGATTQPLEDTVITVWNMGGTTSNKHSLLTSAIKLTTRSGVSPANAVPSYNAYENGTSRSAVYYLKTNQTKDGLTVAEVTHPYVGSNYSNSMPTGVTAGSCLTAEQPVVSIKYKLFIPDDENKDESRSGEITSVVSNGLKWSYANGKVSMWYGGVKDGDLLKEETYPYTPGTWLEIKILFKMNTDVGNVCIGGYAKSGAETEWTQFYYAETSQTAATSLSKFSLAQFNIRQIGSITDDTVVCTTYYDYMGLYATAEEPSNFETTEEKITADIAEISLPASGTTISENLNLPTQGTKGTTFTWTSDKPEVISETGVVTCPEFDSTVETVKLTLVATNGSITAEPVEYTYKVTGDSVIITEWQQNLNHKNSYTDRGRITAEKFAHRSSGNIEGSGVDYALESNEAVDGYYSDVYYSQWGSNYERDLTSYLKDNPVLASRYRLKVPDDAYSAEKRTASVNIGHSTEGTGYFTTFSWTLNGGILTAGLASNSYLLPGYYKKTDYTYTPGNWLEIELRMYPEPGTGDLILAAYAKQGNETDFTMLFYGEYKDAGVVKDCISIQQYNTTQTKNKDVHTYYDYLGIYAIDDIPVYEMPDSSKLDVAIIGIALPESGSKLTENLTLPATGDNNSTFVWTSSNPAVLSNDGKITTPADDTSVTLTLNATCGTANKVVEYTYTVEGLSTVILNYEMKKSDIDKSSYWDWTRDESGEIILDDKGNPATDPNSKGALVNREGYYTTDLFGYGTARAIVTRTSGEITARSLVMSSYTKLPTNFTIGDDEILEIRTQANTDNITSGRTTVLANARTPMPTKFSANESTLEYSYDIYVDEASKAATRIGEINFAGSDVGGKGKYDSTELTFGATISGDDAALSFYSSASQTAKLDYSTHRSEKVNVAVNTMVNVKYIFKVTDLGGKYRIKAYGLYNGVCYSEEVAYVDGDDFTIVSIGFDLYGLQDREAFSKLDNVIIKYYAAGYNAPFQYGWVEGSDYAFLSPIKFDETSKVANVTARLDGYDGKACMILAMYDRKANNTLVKTYIDSNPSDGLSVSSDASDFQSSYYFKAFLVDSISTVNPYTANR